jgi:hypothetical protein
MKEKNYLKKAEAIKEKATKPLSLRYYIPHQGIYKKLREIAFIKLLVFTIRNRHQCIKNDPDPTGSPQLEWSLGESNPCPNMLFQNLNERIILQK